MNDKIRTIREVAPIPAGAPAESPLEDIVQGIFASTLQSLQEAQHRIGRLEAERDQAIARVRELEGGKKQPAGRAVAPSAPEAGTATERSSGTFATIGRIAAAVAMLILLPVGLFALLIHTGSLGQSSPGSTSLTFKDIVELLVIALLCSVLVQSWSSHRK